MRRFLSAIRAWWTRHPLVHPLLAGALVLAIMPAQYGGITRFTALSPGGRAVVDYTVKGCFGGTRARITFRGTPRGVRYTATRRGPGFHHATRSGELTHVQAAELDVAMRRFRNRGPGACSTSEHVTVTRVALGMPVARETYTNETCASPHDAIRFDELLPGLR
jgi:hypothetical protein